MKSIFCRQIWLWFIVIFLAFLMCMRPVHANSQYDDYFKEYVLAMKDASSAAECKNITDAKIQKKIKLAEIYNEKARTPSFAIGKWGYTGPDEAEKRAAEDVGKLCSARVEDIFTLAQSYENGAGDTGKDTDAATSLYMYLFFAHKYENAILQLEEMGYVVQ
jgi:hypothetical protein